MKMIILAAGLGTRMREVCGDRPKVLAGRQVAGSRQVAGRQAGA